MRPSFVRHLRCPDSGAELELVEVVDAAGREGDADIRTGTLRATGTGRTYEIERGMAFVHRRDQTWESKAREAEGWVELYDERGFDLGADFILPYGSSAIWHYVSEAFDAAVARSSITVGHRVLDLGAGRGWAAKHFAIRGCEAVAIDVNGDETIGLGRARAMMDAAGVFFERVVGDGEILPFADATFDAVFASAALHHTNDLRSMLAEVGRVLKPGGELVVGAEPTRVLDVPEETALAMVADDEIRVGITERRPLLTDYLDHSAAAGLEIEVLDAVLSPGEHLADVHEFARAHGAWPTLKPSTPRTSLYGLARYARRSARQSADWAHAMRWYRRLRNRPDIRAFHLLMYGAKDVTFVARKPVATG